MRGLALVLILRALPAGAERVAVNVVVEDGSDNDRALVRAAVERGFLQGGAELVERSRQLLATGVCADDRCRAELGARLSADALVSGRIGKEDDAWVAQLAIFDVALATVTKRDQLACVRCGDKALAERITQLAASLLRAQRTFARATLAVRTRPAGAEVWLDGRKVGLSDLELPVAAGAHSVELVRAPDDRVALAVELTAGERKVVELGLGPRARAIVPRVAIVPPSLVVTDSPVRRRWRSVVGAVALSSGAALAALGIAFLVDNGRGTCELGAGIRQCPELTDSRGAGLGWLVSGALVAVGGVVLLAVDAGRRERR